jgi:DNA polymerase III delta prime subunit
MPSLDAASRAPETPAPGTLLRRALESGRVHSAFLLSGGGDAARDAALDFARGLVCRGEGERPCGHCRDCRLSQAAEAGEPIAIDATGKSGPLYRHLGDHPDLYWIDRGEEGTRVRIGQVRALQGALHLAPNEGGWRVAVIADAEWLNLEAQNALLHLLEEPPPRTCLVLVTASAAGLLATIRSRCQKVVFGRAGRPALRGPEADDGTRALAERLDELHRSTTPELLDWAEQYRGVRAAAAAEVQALLTVGSEWLRQRVIAIVSDSPSGVRGELEAFRALARCRRDLNQRNANPQMVAERALFAIRSALMPA